MYTSKENENNMTVWLGGKVCGGGKRLTGSLHPSTPPGAY